MGGALPPLSALGGARAPNAPMTVRAWLHPYSAKLSLKIESQAMPDKVMLNGFPNRNTYFWPFDSHDYSLALFGI